MGKMHSPPLPPQQRRKKRRRIADAADMQMIGIAATRRKRRRKRSSTKAAVIIQALIEASIILSGEKEGGRQTEFFSHTHIYTMQECIGMGKGSTGVFGFTAKESRSILVFSLRKMRRHEATTRPHERSSKNPS
jgi:hypothetical protein